MANKAQESEDKLQKIMEIERQLNEIQDVDVLLERILTETRRIVNADAPRPSDESCASTILQSLQEID